MKKAGIFILSIVIFLNILTVPTLAAKEKVVLNVNVRDFKADGVLFEGSIASGEGLVADTLGTDHKPIYNLEKWNQMFAPTTNSITMDRLNSFFNDVKGVNMKTKKTITLNSQYDESEYFDEKTGEYKTISGEFYIIDSAVDEMGSSADGFFPIDNELLGNEGKNHNYYFSVEVHATFQYKKGDMFIFGGDDDVWAYFDNTLCVDLGGVHTSREKVVFIDDLVEQGKLNIKEGDYVPFDMFYMERHVTESNMYVKTNIDFVSFNNSEWATYELFNAYENNLIPDRLMDEDLALPARRDEFAAVTVKLYEKLSGQTVQAGENPFTDTDDVDVLKAYELGIVKGTSDTTYSPTALLSRQEAATMLTRVYKKAKFENWSIENDSDFKLTYDIALFADDDQIDDWAKESVYFMAANGVIKGVSDNNFAPKNITREHKASYYGNSSREQSLIISVRSFEKLK